VKDKLRAAIELVLRRLPVARGVYLERDALAARVRRIEDERAEEMAVARFLQQADMASRNRLFDAFSQVGLSDYLYAELGGARFLVNARDKGISRALFIAGASDFDKFETATRLLEQARPGGGKVDVLLDVGANIGSICVPAVLRGFAERAVAVEAQPTNCRLLRANIAINGLADRIEVVERAASDRDGAVLSMELSDGNWGDHRIAASRAPGRYGEAERAHIDVPSIRLESLDHLDASGRMLVWMDVQGYEGHALAGAERLLAATPPLVLEFWPYGILRADSFAALQRSVAHYRGFHDLERPELPLRPIQELDKLFAELGPDGPFTDILVV
jgi:FkbM family methyltransferase